MKEIQESDEKRLMRLEIENEHLNKRLDTVDEKFADLQSRFNDLLRRQKELEESNTEITHREFAQSNATGSGKVHIEYNKHKERSFIHRVRGILLLLLVLAIVYVVVSAMWNNIVTLNYTLNDIPVPKQNKEKKIEEVNDTNLTASSITPNK